MGDALYCRCKRLRSECDARCAVCGDDANWMPETDNYLCEKHAPKKAKALDEP